MAPGLVQVRVVGAWTWLPAYEAFFNDQNDAAQTFVGADNVVFCPEIDPTVYEMMEGTYMVPSSFNATSMGR